VEDYDPSNIASSDVAEMVLDSEGSQLDIVLDNEMVHEPGTEFHYSSGDTMLLSHVIEVATGQSAGDYAAEHLFGPLGVERAQWWEDKSGDTLTYCCLDMTAREFARFGQLFLEGGVLSGKRIVPERWVADSIKPSPSYVGYGYQWWLTGNEYETVPEDTYSAIGHDGQYIHVIPSLNLVVVRHGLYWPHDGEAIADPSLFVVYPSDGLFPESGTAPPDSWSVPEFLAPIVDSVED
jgi:CubicO group peptidase (beta-lactamase class C family)